MALDWRKVSKPVSQFAEFKPQSASANNRKTPQQVLAANIDKQIALAKAPKAEGTRWFYSVGENTAFKVRFANKPLKLDGDDTELVVPTAQLVDVYEAIKADVLGGGFDAQLDELQKMIAGRVEKMALTRANKGPKKKK